MTDLIKICKKCGESKSKDMFPAAKENRDGRSGTCRKCDSKFKCAWAKANREIVNSMHRSWRAANRDKIRAANAEWYARNKHIQRAMVEAWLDRNPDSIRAYSKMNWAIKKGVLVRPTDCDACERSGPVQAHHSDYAKPLDVLWLCVSCHKNFHRLEKTVIAY